VAGAVAEEFVTGAGTVALGELGSESLPLGELVEVSLALGDEVLGLLSEEEGKREGTLSLPEFWKEVEVVAVGVLVAAGVVVGAVAEEFFAVSVVAADEFVTASFAKTGLGLMR
jgi:hypothetical protein